MRKAYKSIISLAVVLIAGLNFIVPALAQDPFTAIAVGGITGASGAGLFGSMAGMSGIDIAWGNNSADQMDAMWNVLNPDHVYFSGEKHEANPQEYPEDVFDYIQVDIGDWLSAQSEYIVNFAQSYNVQDDDTGTITNPPSYAGYPFDPNTGIGSSLGALGVGSYTVGIGTLVINPNGNNYSAQVYVNGVPSGNPQTVLSSSLGELVYLARLTSNTYRFLRKSSGGTVFYIGYQFTDTESSSETINWESNDVNTGVFDGWESAKVKIPHNISQLTKGWTLTDFLNELDRIWYGGGEDNIIIENGGDVPPVPPVPVPDTPLGEVAFDDWIDLWGSEVTNKLDFVGSNGEDQLEVLQDIDTNVGDIEDTVGNIDTNVGDMVSDLDNIDTNITSIEGIAESIDTNVDDLKDTAESIDTNIGIGNGILGGIRSLVQSAVDYLEGIAEHVGELVEEIVEGTEKLIAGILNQIPQTFGVIFGPIKQASSIWHYVVEWIQSIGAPFQFIWSMASGTSYYIILPVYASLAAAVVLAFYKRFGK